MDDENESEFNEPSPATTYAIYLGDGSRYWDGVPARDLTRGEWDEIGNTNIQNHLLSTGLYKLAEAGIE